MELWVERWEREQRGSVDIESCGGLEEAGYQGGNMV